MRRSCIALMTGSALLLAACGGSDSTSSAPATTAAAAQQAASANDADVAFAQGMIPHHESTLR